jgi:hypothetical protein
MTEDTVTITAPVIDLHRSMPSRQHRAVRVHLVEQLPRRPGRPAVLSIRSGDPLVQPVECSASMAPSSYLINKHGVDLAILRIDSHPDMGTGGAAYPELLVAVMQLQQILAGSPLLGPRA